MKGYPCEECGSPWHKTKEHWALAEEPDWDPDEDLLPPEPDAWEYTWQRDHEL